MIKYLLLVSLLCLSTGKLVFQTVFSKKGKRGFADSVFFNAVMFSAIAVIYLPFLIVNGANTHTLICGMIMGFFSLLFQVCYVLAFSNGKASLTVTINNCSLLIPVITSYLLFDESFGVPKLIGIVLIIASFMMTVSKEKGVKEETALNKQWLKWFGFTMVVFLSNGMMSVNQKIYSMTTPKLEVFQFVGIGYLFAALLAWLIFGLSKGKQQERGEAPPYKKAALFAGASGIFLGAFQCVNTYAASVIDGTVLFPVTNCGMSLILTLIGRLFFRERLTVKQYAGMVVGVVAIILICI